jgi:hypothetical protein
MTSESDDLNLQRLTDINYLTNIQRKWKKTRAENHSSIVNFKEISNNLFAGNTSKKEMELIAENLRNLYWETDIINELFLSSSTCKRLVKSIVNNILIIENGLLTRISSLNLHNEELDKLIKNKTEKSIYEYHFLQMILDNFKEIQLQETGNEFIAIETDIKYIINLQKMVQKGGSS